MRKQLLLIFALACFFTGNIIAQKNGGLAHTKGQSTVTAGIGIGNIWKSFLDKAITIPEYKVTSTGPFILIYEYNISRRISAGLQGSYSRANGESKRFQLADQITILSFLARANYHFWTKKKLDPYIGGGLGINKSKYENKDPNTVAVNANSKDPGTFDYSAQIGLKYFPLQHIGLYMEAGYVAGSFVQVGITARF